MEAAVQYDIVMTAMEENQKNIRDMVMESYQDMLEGKGREYTDFFEEMEGKYKNAKL